MLKSMYTLRVYKNVIYYVFIQTNTINAIYYNVNDKKSAININNNILR